jgi:hypothetical protein
MSARAWRQRNVNKRDRLFQRRLARVFALHGRTFRGLGPYQLAVQQQEAFEEHARLVLDAYSRDPEAFRREREGMWT